MLKRGALLAVLVLFGTGPALAETPVEAAVKDWLSAVDASPDWRASYAGLAVDPATDSATLTGVAIASERPGVTLRLATVAISGYRATDDGTFAARQVDVSGAALTAGFLSVSVPKARLSAIVLPLTGGSAWDDSRPGLSLVRLLTPLASVRAASILADSLELIETIGPVESRTTYSQVRLTGWSGGTISLLQSGPLSSDSPMDDPLVSMSVASSESRNIDLGALIHVLDPAAYRNGTGDMTWRQALGSAAYRTVSINIPGAALTIADVGMTGLRVRQTQTLPEWPSAGETTRKEDLSPDALLASFEKLSGYALGGFTLHDVNVKAEGLDHIHLGGLSLKDVSLDSIGEFAMDDGIAELSDQGSVKFGRFAFGGLVPPSIDTLRTAFAALQDKGDADLSALLPQLGFFELGDLALDIADGPKVAVGRYRLDMKDYVGKVPTTVSLAMEGADIPANLIPEHRLSTFLDRFGYDRVHVDAAADIAWKGDTISVSNYRFAMKDLASVSGSATLSGLSPADAEHLHSLDEGLQKLSFTGGELTFEDDSIIARSLDEQAKRLNTDPEKFRQQFATGLPFMLTFLGNPDLQKQLAPVLQSLIRSSGSLTAMAAPASPIAMTALLATATTTPFALLSELGLTFRGTTGAAAPTPAATTPPPASPPAAPPAGDMRPSVPSPD